MFGSIQDGASIVPLTALDRAGDTYKFSFKRVARDANDRIAVSAHVHERNVWREIGIRQSPRLLYVSAV